MREGNSATCREDALYSRMHDTLRQRTPPRRRAKGVSESGVLPMSPARAARAARPLALVYFSSICIARYRRTIRTSVSGSPDVFALSGLSADVVVTCSHGDACLSRASAINVRARARIGEETNPGGEDSRGAG